MPYFRQGRTVYKGTGPDDPNKKVLKTHESEEKAKAHLTALKINVEHKE
jgi:hypothetical protein